ncbi:MAG: hypothetical protein DRO07_00730 [Candidatus Iainarchaeum archaeon]|uniref:Uncharacterized protein n=1 Tax=Candidatus Iainarchaeum sp. TaxID=3101447 RepID=A0A497JJT3_9ARCH|nr:MAG: hypothetical protein DRO07_00730 [Candidatus Diapherotrites archaeon]
MVKNRSAWILVLLTFFLPNLAAFCIDDPNIVEQQYSFLSSLKEQLIEKEPLRSDDLQVLRSGIIAEIELSDSSVISWKAYNTIPVKIELTSSQLKGTRMYYSLLDSQQNLLNFNDSLLVWTYNGNAIVDSFKARTEECRHTNINAALLNLQNFNGQKIVAYAFLPRGAKLQIHCFTGSGQLNVYYFDGSMRTLKLSKESSAKIVTLGYLGTESLNISDIIELIRENKVCVERSANKIRLRWNPEAIFSIQQTGQQQEVQAPLEPDSDSDGIPDTSDSCPTQPETFNGYDDSDGCPDSLPNKPETQVSNYEQIRTSNSMAEYNFIFLPLQWNDSLNATSGTYVESVDRIMNYFIQKTGLQGCNKISKIVMSKEEVRDCGLESINLSCIDTSQAPTLVLNCVQKKRGININSSNNTAIALTNFPNLSKRVSNGCKPIAATTTLFGQPIIVIATNKTDFVLAHELGHRLFYFCDQYDVAEYVNQDFMLKRARMPAFNPGCQNKYPGPYSVVGNRVQALKRYDVSFIGGRFLMSGNPSESCPSYPRCSYEVGDFITCCPNMNKAAALVDCTGRFIPITTTSSSKTRGVSIMGPAFRSSGYMVNIPRDFDCFEKEAIRRTIRC